LLGPDQPRRSRRGHLRPEESLLRKARRPVLQDAQPDDAQSSGTRRRHAISQRDLRELARAGADRQGKDRGPDCRPRLPPPARHAGGRRRGGLAGRGLPPGRLREAWWLVPCQLRGARARTSVRLGRSIAGALALMAVSMLSNTAFGEVGRGDRYSGAGWATRS